jgi:hypothetical protein
MGSPGGMAPYVILGSVANPISIDMTHDYFLVAHFEEVDTIPELEAPTFLLGFIIVQILALVLFAKKNNLHKIP